MTAPLRLPVQVVTRMRLTRPATVLLLAIVVGCSGSGDAPMDDPAPAIGPSTAQPAATAAAPRSSAEPTPGETRGRSLATATDVPSRVVIEALSIDLPVVSGDLIVPGNARDYPLCDVAQYLTSYRYPGRLGATTWIYGHARNGMFLPLLEASRREEGAGLVGATVLVYSTSSLAYRYRITGVHPHQTDRTIASDVAPDEGRLVLQTSEGPRGTVPKLQVSAVLVDVAEATSHDALPSAAPRACDD